MTNYTSLMPDAVTVVREAGEMLMRFWREPREIRHKGRIDLVTSADIALEKLLKERLESILPGAGFLAEESADADDLQRTLTGPTWIIDPLDGTTNFAHGIPFVAISVALWDEGEVQLGLVHMPVLNELFHAARGHGAFVNDVPIHVSSTRELEQALVATGFPYTVRERMEPILAWMEIMLASTRGIRRAGSAACDLAYTACGRFDAFYELDLKPWDVAAGWLLVQEAGGLVSRIDQTPFDLHASSILAGNSLIHAKTAEALAEYGGNFSGGKG
ncbi:inositol monophosphatase family protein [Desulfonatronum thiosulfatophilum]